MLSCEAVEGSSSSSSSRGGGGAGSSKKREQVVVVAECSSSECSRRTGDMLEECAVAVGQAEWERAVELLAAVAARVSAQGESSGERVRAWLAAGLAARLGAVPGLALSLAPSLPRLPTASVAELQAAYLALNQVTPFMRFAHLTANQAILEAVEEGAAGVHILDLDIMQGVQWPPLMQALAQREPVPRLRITACATPRSACGLHQTGLRLAEFATSLGLPFQFHTAEAEEVGLVDNTPQQQQEHGGGRAARPLKLWQVDGEALAVNCVLSLHRLPAHGVRPLLHALRALHPRVLALAEREADHDQAPLRQRLAEAAKHYGAIFESLEATLPPRSPDRLNLEQLCFGREMANILACDGAERTERHHTHHHWRALMHAAGFSSLAFSTFALAQAQLLLRLHYPSEGYTLNHDPDGCLFLGWQDRPLFAVSAWS